MYVCMYKYVYIFTCIHVCVWIHVYVYINSIIQFLRVSTCEKKSARALLSECMCVCAHVCVSVFLCEVGVCVAHARVCAACR